MIIISEKTTPHANPLKSHRLYDNAGAKPRKRIIPQRLGFASMVNAPESCKGASRVRSREPALHINRPPPRKPRELNNTPTLQLRSMINAPESCKGARRVRSRETALHQQPPPRKAHEQNNTPPLQLRSMVTCQW